MSVPLLKTKLHLPHLRPHLVSRAHLLRRLNENLVHAGEFTRKLTLIAAPAGYGKTTLATEWLCEIKLPNTWLLLGESDNDPTRFLTYFIAALQQIQEELGQFASAILQSPQTPPIEIILTTLLNEIETLPHPFILTLDDYHTIRTPAIHQHLAFIMDHQPSKMHLVMTTREDPLLPVARLRALQQVLEIRQEDLRFTTSEITRFLKQVMNLSLSSEEIAALERRVDQSFRLHPSSFILEQIEQANLFIVPLDQSRTWYRYHRLFAELLRHRLRMFNSDIEVELHSRASDWFEQSCPLLLTGQYETIAPLLDHVEQMAQNIPSFLGEVLAAQAYLARGMGNHARMIEYSERAMALLPKSSVNSRGLVALNLGLAYWHMGNMRAAEETLAEAVEAGQATDNHYMLFTAMVFQGRVFAVRGELHRAADIFRVAIDRAGQIPINALAYLDLSMLYYEWNELDESEMHLEQATVLSQRAQNDEFLVACWMMQARLRLAQGDKAGAEEALNKGWVLVRSEKIPEASAARLDTAQALYSVTTDGNSTAMEWVGKLNERIDCHNFYRFLGITKGRLLVAAGDLATARAYLAQIYDVATQNEWKYGAIAARVWQAQLEVLRLVTAGLSNREISKKLFITIGTAKTHVHKLCGKMGVRNRTEAAVRTKELRLV